MISCLERTLWSVSLLCLGVAGWSWSATYLYQTWARDAVRAPISDGDAIGLPPYGREPLGEPVAAGAPIALLEIPRLGLSAVVAEGTSRRVLARAIGHLPDSALPGTRGNVALAAHRDTFFRPLERIEVGDVLVLESSRGKDFYQVEWTDVVAPTDVQTVDTAGYAALTLVTCHPFAYVGSAPRRFIVRARLLEEEGAIAAARDEVEAARQSQRPPRTQPAG